MKEASLLHSSDDVMITSSVTLDPQRGPQTAAETRKLIRTT